MQSSESAEIDPRDNTQHETQEAPCKEKNGRLESKVLSSESISRGVVLTFGVFDGVHVAHQIVVNRVANRARALGAEGVVISFDPHPALPISGAAPPILTSTDKKIELLQMLGIDRIIVEDFNEQFSRLSPEEFVRDVLVRKFHTREAVVGYDCAFGRDRTGDEQLLKKLGRRYGFSVEVVQPYKVEGAVVSSTRIRAAILKGNLELVEKLLGRSYSISGRVVQGKGIGRRIGYATANLELQKQVLPPSGVYAVTARVGAEKFKSILNMGMQRTFGDNDFRVEVHLLDFEGDLYGRNIEVFFVKKVRDERTFNSPPELADQIRRDEIVAREVLDAV